MILQDRQVDAVSAAGRETARPRRAAAFTLVEMIAVIGIILVLLTLVLPAVQRLWEDRKLADADNSLRGALMVARRTAMSPGTGDAGLLFTLDAEGVQRIYPIEQQPDPTLPEHLREIVSQNRFVISPGQEYSLLEPIRAVPRYAIIEQTGDNAPYAFDPFELAYDGPIDGHGASPTQWQEAQRHRNYFSMVFSSDGQLKVWRDVLIFDEDVDNAGDGDGFGDRTGLPVPDPSGSPNVFQYFVIDEEAFGGREAAIDPTGNGLALSGLVVDHSQSPPTAINFPSVDGVLIYDDSGFRAIDATGSSVIDRREYLLRTAQPLYVVPSTGEVVRGPLGESVVPE
jgi:type II secretory pathway pseudopilin PulG